ncbi:hypothetical protein [Acidithiobacillus sp. HP-11]|jgi:hypothetical protein|uniref:hypothetical protein n=1 Tax=Acidithiobacillus sp. HP-11 TaxID=2697656 RepID=UPI00187AE4B5|nr:hypothetical protein [Acidithiobacillus sp. HP-11]MBE7566945.1 hypothetical protein [Acidithiobacillus sp. HP-11]
MAGEYLALYVKHPSDIDFCWNNDDDDEVFDNTLKKLSFNDDEINNYKSLKTEYIDLLKKELKTLWDLVNGKMVTIVEKNGFKRVNEKNHKVYLMRRMEEKKHKMSLYFQIIAIDNNVMCQFWIWSKGGKAASQEMLRILSNESWYILSDWPPGYVVHQDIIIKDFMDIDQKSVDLQKLAKAIVQPFRDINKDQWKQILTIAN